MKIDLIVVGKLKQKELIEIEHNYFKRLPGQFLTIHEVKANAENLKAESDQVIKKISSLKSSQFSLVYLSEHAKAMDSLKFSEFIYKQSPHLIMVISGADGFHQSLLDLHHKKLSLSPLTFTHRIARILLVEQLYRAHTIHTGHPYHN